MNFTLEEHRHRFAVWAAARASQRGFTTVSRLRSALECCGIRAALARPQTLEVAPDEFDVLHRQWCSAVCESLHAAGVPNVTYGRAAKLVAVYLKTLVTMGATWDTPLGRSMHPPIDRILLQTLGAAADVSSPHKSAWRKTRWTRLDQAGYSSLIEQLRGVLGRGQPFWVVERYWEPAESVDSEA